MKTVVLATNNAHKAEEISTALAFPDWHFFTLKELGVTSDPAEDATDFLGNARIKALAARQAVQASLSAGTADPRLTSDFAVLADDSGLEVDALNGAPGVYSSRYAGVDGDDEANNSKLLAELSGVEEADRTARFVCTLVFLDSDGAETTARGTVEGRIGHELQGEGGFGYDPLFWPDVFEGQCTLAEVPQARKNEVSHRGNALRALREKLQ